MNHLSEESLNEYLDSALGPSACAEVDAHLSSCPACRAQLEALRILFARLESLPEVELEHDMSSAVVMALEDRVSVPPAVRLAVFVQALAILAILALAWPLFNLDVVALNQSIPLNLPSPTELTQWFVFQWTSGMAWMQMFARPSLGAPFSLNLDPPAMLLTLTIVSACLLWLVGNGLLLRPRAGSYKRRHS